MATVAFGSFSKRRNSTKQPQSLSDQKTVTLKDSCSQDRPVFICTGNNFNYNYCMWASKYYFIDEIVSLKNNLIEIHCILDPLATYKTEILASTQYVCYSSQSGNAWLPDTRIPVLKNTVATKSGASLSFINTTGFYVLSVVGGNTGVGGCEVFAVNKSTLNALIQAISTWSSQDVTDIMQGVIIQPPSYGSPSADYPADDNLQHCFSSLITTIKNICDSLGTAAKSIQDSANDLNKKIEEASAKTGFLGNAYANAPQCIRSCIWVPFDIAAFTGSSGAIYLGKYDTGQAGFKVNASPTSGTVSVSIPWHYSDWRRGYCEDVYLYLPFVGMVSYSSASLTHVNSISIDYSVTATDGNVCYEVKAGNEILGTYGGNCATNYPIGVTQQASAGEVTTALLAGVTKTIAAATQSSLSPLSAGAALGQMAVGIAVAGYEVKDVQESTHFSCIGGIGGGAGVGLDLSIYCYTVAHDTIITPADMKDTMGLPTMKPMSLSSLTGYCQCANAHVEAPATAGELDAIDTYLNSGFFIE